MPFVGRKGIEPAIPYHNQTLSMKASEIFNSQAKSLAAPPVQECDTMPAAMSAGAGSKREKRAWGDSTAGYSVLFLRV